MLSVVVPAYREAETIHASLALLLESLRHGEGTSPFEVVLVSDASDDDTAAEARRHDEVTVLEYPEHRGKGYALRYGAQRTAGDIVVFIDADMELHPDGIARLVEMVREGADVAVGSKSHPESRVNYPWFRRAQSRAYQLLVRALFDLDVTDTQTGLKAFRGELLRRVLPTVVSDGFGYDLELLVALHDEGARIVEGPVQLDYAFSTTTSARAAADVLRDTVRLYVRRWRQRNRGGHAATTQR